VRADFRVVFALKSHSTKVAEDVSNRVYPMMLQVVDKVVLDGYLDCDTLQICVFLPQFCNCIFGRDTFGYLWPSFKTQSFLREAKKYLLL
jgi:hypothetical protein